MGVFSLKQFRAHEMIGPIRGTVMEDPDYESDYCMELGENMALEPAAPFRYLNHSCHPNCELVEAEARDVDDATEVPKLWLEVLSEIAPGEQMTIDYRWPADAAIRCGCGSADCRGWIVAPEQRDQIDPRRHPEMPLAP
jgi:hypothetical protein